MSTTRQSNPSPAASRGGAASSASSDDLPYIPARMLNEYVYCPRLFALEWMNGEWADSADTVKGRTVHRRVDKPGRASLPDPQQGDPEPVVARSVNLGSPELGIVARIDLVEAEGDEAIPVDYKRGKAPDLPQGAWEPERVQVCAQGLLLRAHGYRSDHGVLYFAASRKRVEIPFSEELVRATLCYRDQALELARGEKLPPPLVDSRKCPRCSLVGICLPDEHNHLTGKQEQVRPLVPARDDGVPLYVRYFGGSIGKDHMEIVVRDRGREAGRARIDETSRLVVLGNPTVTTPLLRELARRDIPVSFHSYGGWFYGQFSSSSGRNVLGRIAQHRKAADSGASLRLARSFIRSKVRNSRVMLRRNGKGVPSTTLFRMKELADQTKKSQDLQGLLGVEGGAARLYFQSFPLMIKTSFQDDFAFTERNRRPPRDPVNSLLSFAYACLAREITAIIAGTGLDPYVGFLHQPRPGRPALALDLMEEFRPVIADSVVISAINNGVLGPADFIVHTTGCTMTDSGRKRFIQVFERRMDELATHPTFGTRLSYRRILDLQVRLLGKVLLDELKEYPEYSIR